MEKFSYKVQLLTVYFVSVTIIVFLTYNLFSIFSDANVGKISQQKFSSTLVKTEQNFHDYFQLHFSTIEAISNNKDFIKYLSNSNMDKTVIENNFLTLKKSIPCLTQIRYIDNNGMEVIRIDGTSAYNTSKKSISKIVDKKDLQNKSKREYIKQFLLLNKNEIGISKMELNMEHGKVTLPKEPIIRLAMSVYDNKNNKKGIVVINLCLKKLFKQLNKSNLYYVHLIDKEGRYINHYYKDLYGLEGKNPEYSIYNSFKDDATEVLNNNSHISKNFVSQKIDNFNNPQELRLILELKFYEEFQDAYNMKQFFIFITVVFTFLLLILVFYFSQLPDRLKHKALKNKLTSRLTSLPNKLALMEDLSDNKFENSVVILISINNIVKIRNTYGYNISNQLLVKIAETLNMYKDENIEKIYSHSFSVFALVYKYTDKRRLQNFLNGIHKDLENHSFDISFNGDSSHAEFLLNITFGVSDPSQINNSIEELYEAENALDYAMDTKKDIIIFTHSFKEKIKENKENITKIKQLKTAIDDDKIILHYQPIYNNKTKTIEKYECLIRIDLGDILLYPDSFLPIAKQTNKYNILTYTVIQKAFEYFKDKEYEFSVNLSVLDIENPKLQDMIFELLSQYNLKDKVVLEIVEQEGVDNYDEFFDFIKKVKMCGCKIAIDDFGSGYSNFEYIIKMSDYIDYIKIDGSLIKNIDKDDKAYVLVESLKFLSDNLQIKTIAEYVEDETILEHLNKIGIDYSQGYYIGRPEDRLQG